MTSVCGANIFPMHKQLPNPYFQNSQTFFFVFLMFSSNKCWWRLPRIFLFWGCSFAFRLALLSTGRLRQPSTFINGREQEQEQEDEKHLAQTNCPKDEEGEGTNKEWSFQQRKMSSHSPSPPSTPKANPLFSKEQCEASYKYIYAKKEMIQPKHINPTWLKS